MEAIRVGLVGGTGYSGMELLRLLGMHPKMDLSRVTSRRRPERPCRNSFLMPRDCPFPSSW